ncbi:MAG TPA: ATP-binding protein [Anaeromyxobacter sp.]|nr:ATP-binding protein [Anaeromyxobacter sp.]
MRGAEVEADGLHRKLVWITLSRVVWVTLLLGGAAAVSWRSDTGLESTRPLYPVVVASYLASIVFGVLLRRRRSLVPLAYLEVALDVFLAGAVVALTGLAESVFVFMYSVAIVSGAILLYRRGAVLAVALALPVHFAVQVALGPARMPIPWALLFVHGGAFAVTGGLAAYLADMLRRTGEQLAASESHLANITALHESIIQSVTSGLLTLDLQGRVTFLNRAGEQMLGVPARELTGKPAGQQLAAFGPETARGEADYSTPHGEARRLGYSSFRLLGRGGEAAGTAIIFQDLTQLRAMEERVARTERLADLGRLAAGLAHELRNPLASMMGAQELLAQAPGLDEENRRLMEIALRESARLAQLVTQFLEFARPVPTRRERCDLASLAAETLEAFVNDPVAGKVVLERDLRPAPTEGDPDQLRQVLWNLLLNAAQAAGDGGAEPGHVRVACGASGQDTFLVVDDDGPGVDPSNRERIFLPFFTTKPLGTGLGLANVHRLIDAHGGSIAVETSPAGGARFRVILPAEPARVEGR